MLFSKYLLVSEEFDNHIDILKGLQQNVLPEGSVLLCVNRTTPNLMEIYSINEFERPHVKTDDLLIIAICKNRKDARDKCANILADYVAEHKNFERFKEKFCIEQKIIED